MKRKLTLAYLIIVGLIFCLLTVRTFAAPFLPAVGGTGNSNPPTKGDLLVGSSTTIYAQVGVGSNGKVLTASSSAPYGISWEAVTATGDGVGVTTSGLPVATNIAFFTNPSTISGSSSLTYTSSTNTFGVIATSTFTGKFTQTGGLVGLASTTITGTAAVTGVTSLNGLTNNGNATTTNITITAISGSTQCLHVNSAGVVTGTGSDCGAGGSGTVTTSSAVTVGYFPTWGTTSALTGTSTIFQSGTSVGIGTTQPSSTLHVIGDINTSNGAYKLGNLYILNGSSTIGTTFAGIRSGNGNTTGQNNTYLGYQSGFINATSNNNTIVGASAGYNNATQFFGSTFVGYYAGNANTSGYGNAFFGYQSGMVNTSSIQNTYIGTRSGENAGGGNGNNVAIGYLSGLNLSGTENTFIGATAGQNTTGDKNVFIGSGVGSANTTGQLNTFVGSGAGFSNTAGLMNIFMGNQAGYSNDTGQNIIAIGDHAGFTNTQNDGFYIGNYAGQLSTGAENTFVGQNAGRLNTTGLANTNLGIYAGYNNATGSYNTFIGNRAGNSGNPNQSVFLGYQAGDPSTGTDGVFIGFQSGKNKTSGNDNQFMGSYAGYSNTTGASNVLIGSQALYSNATGSNNTALGYQAGYYNKGQRNVFLGNNAGQNETGDDTLYIANSNTASPLIYGNFATSRLGVNTSQPSSTVHVVGTATITASTTLSYITGSTQCLHVNSAGLISGTGSDCGAGGGGSGTVTTSSAVTAGYFPTWATTNGSGLNGTSSIFQSGSNIGIGTTQPSSTLHVIGGLITSLNTTTTNLTVSGLSTGIAHVSSAGVFSSSAVGLSTADVTGVLPLANGGTNKSSFTAGSIVFASSTTILGENNANLFWDNVNNRLGVGTSQPSSTVQIIGNLQIPTNSTLSLAGQISVKTTSSTLNYYDGTAERVLSSEICTQPTFTIEYPSASEDNQIWVARATSTITKFKSFNRTDGDTVTLNLIWGSSPSGASSTSKHLFTSNVTSTATSSIDIYPTLVSFASTTVSTNDVVRLISSSASSTKWSTVICYRENP